MSFRIYTKTGDAGTTALIGGTRVSKANIRIESYGTVDELNSCIGFAGDLMQDERGKQALREAQDRLFTIGSSLACDPEKDIKMAIPDLHDGDVAFLEKEIDALSQELPPMRSFILPGGHPATSALHIARCVARRTERICVHMHDEGLAVEPLVLRYLNRLSDYLFVLARYEGHVRGTEEMPWKARV